MKTKGIMALLAVLAALCVIQSLLAVRKTEETNTETDISEGEIYIEGTEPINEQDDIYDLSGYIVTNSQKFTQRLDEEVNNMANDKIEKDHLYEVANGIRINAKSYYTMLGNGYEEGAYELVDSAKSYVFNSEALAYNIMKYIKVGKTEYISRAMMCLSADEGLLYNFRKAQEEYRLSHPEETEEGTPAD